MELGLHGKRLLAAGTFVGLALIAGGAAPGGGVQERPPKPAEVRRCTRCKDVGSLD